MQAIVHPSKLSGRISAPPSKSSMQRACAAGLLHRGKTFLTNIGKSNDDEAAKKIIQQLGANLTEENDMIKIESNGLKPSTNMFSVGESGLSVRMFTPIVALLNQESIITGEGSLMKREMSGFQEYFGQLGVKFELNENKLPLKIFNSLIPKSVKIDGKNGSQYLTGLLMAYSYAIASGEKNLNFPLEIAVENLQSKPYIDLTLDVLQKFYLPVPQNFNYEKFVFNHSSTTAQEEICYHVEGDWSNAAFLFVAGAIAGKIKIDGVSLDSSQADKAIYDVLMEANADIAFDGKCFLVNQTKHLKSFEFSANDCPDLFPPLTALAIFCEGISKISGVNRLWNKESNRADALISEFKKLGVKIWVENDDLLIEGKKEIIGAEVNSHNDHRIAMALTVAGLRATSPTTILQPIAVKKSYPQFYKDLKSLNGKIILNWGMQ